MLAQVFLPSDLPLADLTDPRVLGRFGLTNEMSMGSAEAVYALAQRWALRLWQAGLSGIHYGVQHDTPLASRSVAVFGKPDDATYLSDDAILLQPPPSCYRVTYCEA